MFMRICEEFPYLALAYYYFRGCMEHNGSPSILPRRSAYFYKLLLGCILTMQLKFLLNRPRPVDLGKPLGIPPGWKKKEDLPMLNRSRRILLVPTRALKQMQMQPEREVCFFPVFFSDLKNKYSRGSGTPSAHSFVAGCLVHKVFRDGSRGPGKKKVINCRVITVILLLGVSASRVFSGDHFPYQVVLGTCLGGAYDWILHAGPH